MNTNSDSKQQINDIEQSETETLLSFLEEHPQFTNTTPYYSLTLHDGEKAILLAIVRDVSDLHNIRIFGQHGKYSTKDIVLKLILAITISSLSGIFCLLLVLFSASKIVLGVFLCSFLVAQLSIIILCYKLYRKFPASYPKLYLLAGGETFSIIIAIASLITSLVSMIVSLFSIMFNWRKEKRDEKSFDLDNKKKELEIEKLKKELSAAENKLDVTVKPREQRNRSKRK